MLGRQHLRGRQQGRLRPVFNGDERRHDRHYGLSAANIPLHQAPHRRFRHHVALDLAQDPSLGGCQPIGQQCRKRPGIAVRHLKGISLFLPAPAASQGQSQLQKKQFVKDETPAGGMILPLQQGGIVLQRGKMQLPQGTGKLYKTVPLQNRLWDGIHNRIRMALRHLAPDTLGGTLRQAFRQRIDRQNFAEM